MTISGADRETTLKQVLRLVDLSRDLQRATEDRGVVEAGGQIRYVLDENIFEMFVRPYRHRDGSETFYGDIWSDSGTAPAGWRAFESQAAMITSEVLVMGRLPGARSDQILMTEPHRWELSRRVDSLVGTFARRCEVEKKHVHETLQAKIELLRDLAERGRQGRASTNGSSEDSTLERDLYEIASEATADVVDRTRVARRAAAKLAQDDLTEPLEQLRRVSEARTRARLCAMQTLPEFMPTQREMEVLEKDAEEWFSRLLNELQKPGHANRRRAEEPKESATALWNDARSIAYLRWIANSKMSPGERLAFVTGDLVVFDTYRRWHASRASLSGGPTEPFFMRRAAQYSPIFGIDSVATDFGRVAPGGSDLFSMIEQAVEAALLPLTFPAQPTGPVGVGAAAEAIKSERQAERVPANRRELLALKLVDAPVLLEDQDLSVLSDQLSAGWGQQQRNAIERVRSHWQKAHRLTIGASYDIISGRLSPAQRRIVEDVTSKPTDDVAQLLNEYVSRVLEQLLVDSMQLWVPLAQDIMAGGGIAALLPARFTACLVFPEPAPTEEHPVQVNTSIIFARAAVRALELQDASNANRFADLALRAGGANDDDEAVFPLFEREYLCAVTYRFLIGVVGDLFLRRLDKERNRATVRRAIADVKDRYARASRLLHGCISRHYSDITTSEDHLVRYVRALSERAALHLFIASALGLVRSTEDEELLLDAHQYVEVAKGDLRICLEYDSTLGSSTLAERVRTQYMSNIAAAEVVRCVILRGKGYRFDESLRSIVPRIEAMGSDPRGKHALLRAELAGFAVLAGKRIKGLPPSRFGAKVELTMLALPLDRELLDAIERYVL